MKSLVLILPADLQAKGNAVAIALGHDVPPGSTYSVALSPAGVEPATHYGCHTWATEQFAAMINSGKTGGPLPPAPWALAGITESDVRDVCAALIMSERAEGSDAYQHFQDVLAGNGLQRSEA